MSESPDFKHRLVASKETFAEFERMAGVAVDWSKRAEQEPHYLTGFTVGALVAFKEFWEC